MAYGPHIHLINNEVWEAIVKTFRRYDYVIEKGIGQELMQHFVAEASGKSYSKRRIRRVLLAALSQDRVSVVPHSEMEAKGYNTDYLALRLRSPKPLRSDLPPTHGREALWQFDFAVLYKKKVFNKIILCNDIETAIVRAQRRGGEILGYRMDRCH